MLAPVLRLARSLRTAPAAEPAAAPTSLRISVRVRLAAYTVVLFGVGCWSCFTHLSRGQVGCDEASFAYTTDRILLTNDWVVMRIEETRPHLNAAPLYNWLSALTAHWFDGGYLKYRVWSAAFGVGCALLTLVLGTLLFRAEVGFLAGLGLLLNHHLVFLHGCREGVMEPGLAFFVIGMVICYVRTHQSERQGLWWAVLGACLGGAVLMKPPAIAGFIFCTLGLHQLLSRRDLSILGRLRGPVIAGLAGAVVGLPWYVALYYQLGPASVQRLWVGMSVGRMAGTGGQSSPYPPTLYTRWAWESSDLFKVALPALALGLVFSVAGRRRFAWSVPALVAGAFIAVISAAATKHPHYVYTAFPFLSLLGAAMLLSGFDAPVGSRFRRFWAFAAVLGVVGAGVVVYRDARVVKHELRRPPHEYPPETFHIAAADDLAAGRARLILYRFPTGTDQLDRAWRFTATERYYCQFRLPHATRVFSIEEMNALLADGTPAVVVLPPAGVAEDVVSGGLRPPESRLRVDSRVMAYDVLGYNGADSRYHLRELFGRAVIPDNARR